MQQLDPFAPTGMDYVPLQHRGTRPLLKGFVNQDSKDEEHITTYGIATTEGK